ncbi:ion channel [Candidatus Halobeggiatoa sp. HSG11]|nr:ion channel [Candidatus Halobeggiatoa sp. HSG11]
MIHKKTQCCYIDPEGNRCTGNAGASNLCYWHDPDIIKQGNDKHKLEKMVQNGNCSMAGFSLKYANLKGITLTKPGVKTTLNFAYADFYHANLKNAHLFHIDLHGGSLMKADLSGANLNCANLEKVNLLGTNFENTKIEHVWWGKQVKQEEMAYVALKAGKTDQAQDLFEQAEEIYRNLYKSNENRGLFDQAGRFLYREMVMRRFQHPLFSSERFISKIVDLFCGYGEKPLQVILFALIIICSCALFYFNFGINSAEGNLIAFDSELTMQQNLYNFANCLYFSVVTFTTLGYGDLSPFGITRIIAAIEAFGGAFTIALFVVVFVKKMTR